MEKYTITANGIVVYQGTVKSDAYMTALAYIDRNERVIVQGDKGSYRVYEPKPSAGD